MAFVTGLFLLDAPASALNNLGSIPGERVDNTAGVKMILTPDGKAFPYVSAQAFRYWVRTTAERRVPGWKAAPVIREEKIAYTDSNPLRWWDDDLFGYMRAPTKRGSRETRGGGGTAEQESVTSTVEPVTRSSPFRVSTLVSIAPVKITTDFGVMARHEGDPVPFEHQLYRTTLQGLFSLDLHACGTFSYRNKAGYRHLDEPRIKEAQELQLEHLEQEKAYRLPLPERIQRIRALFEALALLEGGAKLAIHYTDVAPVLCLLAVTRGGNHLFGHVIGARGGVPQIKREALRETLTVMRAEILSPLYVGWVRGYLDEQREEIEQDLASLDLAHVIRHPREAFRAFGDDLAQPANSFWFE
ncbi:type I-B CRISPR-associated protein Cas7/Cst2/DevR [Thermogemmatispora onikobensis]|uniref:type I-B CRISPR-associated protein Cas7/Cst2/DevR n=1 Tax=Thermogemmatispora onikobensis TaxID=732234 RepID=UPI000853D09D|nr:type I-B CRISPR-associated protein Cas7/Cst2/DevR [Thermogemmatispora onikobensis]